MVGEMIFVTAALLINRLGIPSEKRRNIRVENDALTSDLKNTL